MVEGSWKHLGVERYGIIRIIVDQSACFFYSETQISPGMFIAFWKKENAILKKLVRM